MAGNVVGAAVGGVIGGPVGAVAGSALAPVVREVLNVARDFYQRVLSPREEHRVQTVADLAGLMICDRLNAGEQLRQDDFFDASNDRSAAEEVFEAVLKASQHQAQERKLPYLAALMSEIAFNESIGRDLAAQFVRTAEALTYRQLVLISAIWQRSNQASSPLHALKQAIGIGEELLDLGSRGIMNLESQISFSGSAGVYYPHRLNTFGGLLHNYMGLADIPQEERDTLYEPPEKFVSEIASKIEGR